MGYVRHRMLVHLTAFLIGALYLSWTLLGLCVLAHHFISPAQTAQIRGNVDIDELRIQQDTEKISAFSRTVRILTMQSSFFSGLWYLAGMGIGSFF